MVQLVVFNFVHFGFQIELIRNARSEEVGGNGTKEVASKKHQEGNTEIRKKKLVKRKPKQSANDSAFCEEVLRLSPIPKKRRNVVKPKPKRTSNEPPIHDPHVEQKNYIGSSDMDSDLFDDTHTNKHLAIDGFMHVDSPRKPERSETPKYVECAEEADMEHPILLSDWEDADAQGHISPNDVDDPPQEVAPSPRTEFLQAFEPDDEHADGSEAEQSSNHSADNEEESADEESERSDEEQQEDEEENDQDEGEQGEGDEGNQTNDSDESEQDDPESPIMMRRDSATTKATSSAAVDRASADIVRASSSTGSGRNKNRAAGRTGFLTWKEAAGRKMTRKSTVPQLVPRKLFRIKDVRDDGVEVSFFLQIHSFDHSGLQ